MNELNLEALTIAAALDEERAAGNVRGPLHGIPLSIKDNIGTGDQMHNTGGAAAMQTAKADRDAFVAAKLREAGAVILGKSEWAGWIYPAQPGFSALGGQSVNPLDPRLPVYGSSSGSAVSTSANLVAGSIGTETLGSTSRPSWTRTRFRASPTSAVGLYLGVDKPEGLPDPLPADEVTGLLQQLGLDAGAAGLEAAGAEVVLVWGTAPDNNAEFFQVGHNGFRLALADYIAATDPSHPIKTAADVVAFNEQDPATYAPRRRAERLRRRADRGGQPMQASTNVQRSGATSPAADDGTATPAAPAGS